MSGYSRTKRVGKYVGAGPGDGFTDDTIIGFPSVGLAPEDASIGEILAAVSAPPGDTQHRLRILEDRIRRQWAVLQDMVREHTDLVGSLTPAPARPAAAALPAAEPVAAFHKSRSLVPPPRRLRRAG